MSRSARTIRVVIQTIVIFLAGSPPGRLVADEVFGSKTSKVYHSRDCASARKIGAASRVRFASPKEAEMAGRRLCKNCANLVKKEDQEKAAKDKPSDPKPAPAGNDPKTPTTRPAEILPGVEIQIRKVLAGGSFELDGHDKARLLGIVCPEEGQPGDREAVRLLKDLTRSKTIRVEKLTDAKGNEQRDCCGRLLLVRAANSSGDDMAAELLLAGCAWVDREAVFPRRDEFQRLEEKAWWGGKGLWKRNEGPNGVEEVVIGRDAHHYHPIDCPHNAHLVEPSRVALNEAKGRRLPPCVHYREKRRAE